MQRVIPVPTRLHLAATSWSKLCFVNTPQNLAEIERWARTADDPQGLMRLHELIDWNLGYMLFRAVEAVKVELSSSPTAMLRFQGRRIDIAEPVRRTDFERAVSPITAMLGGCVDSLLQDCGLAANDIGAVFLTGGTSLVPCVRALFSDRFGERVLDRDAFTSVGLGLGYSARDRWR